MRNKFFKILFLPEKQSRVACKGKKMPLSDVFPLLSRFARFGVPWQGRIIILLLQELPKGSEKGKFLSLDLGGTNFRVIFMELTKDKVKQCSLLNV